jgi:hypothetical protein
MTITKRGFPSIRILAALVVAIGMFCTVEAAAVADETSYRFRAFPVPGSPYGVVADAKGNLYGVASDGVYNFGIVFRLSPDSNGNWTSTILHTFTGGADGGNPAGIMLDALGNIYGFTSEGGSGGEGVFFEMTLSEKGQWEEKVLYSFTALRGNPFPNGPVMDGAGNFFGEYFDWGPPNGYGSIFELSRSSNGQWAETTIYTFGGGADGGAPFGQLAFDSAGNLYGTGAEGGSVRRGVVFKLTPVSTRGVWSESVLYDFSGPNDGYLPESGVVFDGAGNIYGTTGNGGAAPNCNASGGCATVFELSPTASGEWVERVLYSFGDTGPLDGLYPYGLTFDAAGNLFGVTYWGGSDRWCYNGCGTVFELSPSGDGQWSTRIVHNFTGKPGYNPTNNVVTLPGGRVFGTTTLGGTDNGFNGTVFELAPE